MGGGDSSRTIHTPGGIVTHSSIVPFAPATGLVMSSEIQSSSDDQFRKSREVLFLGRSVSSVMNTIMIVVYT